MARLKRGRKTWIVAKTFVAAALIVLLVANLSLGDKRIEERVETLYTVADPQFRRTMDVMLGPALLGGNRAQALLNGDQIFGDMLQAIRGARRTITFESYIYWSGEIGAQFTSALAERAKAGVKVHVLFDALGSGKIDDRAVEEMKAAGVEVEKYNPLRWNTLATINNRTHRKIMVVDGRIGYTGGVGIADEWRGNAQDPEHWRDTHFRLEGPAVAQMQAAFMENWIEVTGHVLHGEAYFPELGKAGGAGGAVHRHLAGRRLGEHAAHVPAVDRRGGEVDPALGRVLRPRRRRDPHAGRGRASAACACRSSFPARKPTRRRCAALRARPGASCCAPASRSTSTSRPSSTAR